MCTHPRKHPWTHTHTHWRHTPPVQPPDSISLPTVNKRAVRILLECFLVILKSQVNLLDSKYLQQISYLEVNPNPIILKRDVKCNCLPHFHSYRSFLIMVKIEIDTTRWKIIYKILGGVTKVNNCMLIY